MPEDKVTPEMEARNKAEKIEEDFIVIPTGFRDYIQRILRAYWNEKI